MAMKWNLVALTVACALLPAAAQAGRPLASDDAGTTDAGTCQLESWVERAGTDRALVLAPACGIAKGMELGADYTLPHPRDVLRAASGVAFKWVPEAWRIDTLVGELNFGLKLSAAFEYPAGTGWRPSERGGLILATLKPADAWTMHANLGAVRERNSGTTATQLNLALVWTPHDDAVLFAETQANNRRPVFGGTVNSIGARWWLNNERLGLDLSASREAGGASTMLWTFGLGWYGIAF